MDQNLRADVDQIVHASIDAVLPDASVQRALANFPRPKGKIILVSVGKAAWKMAEAAQQTLGEIDEGIIITKYDHCVQPLPGIRCYEAGHPVPDANGFAATKKAIQMVSNLKEEDTVLFLLSGGGSALFEDSIIPLDELQEVTKQLLSRGANIVEINTIRKRLSRVKGGRFAELCQPAMVYSIILSDIIGDPLDMIASGPTSLDRSTTEDARAIIQKYQLDLSPLAKLALEEDTPKELKNCKTVVTGSVRELTKASQKACEDLGYKTIILTDELTCEASEAGKFLSAILRTYQDSKESLAFIAGGETVVHLTGSGLGGRNQELALAASLGISEIPGAAVFSVGSDGTDGPTDAAGGYVDYQTLGALEAQGVDVDQELTNNDSYHVLEKVEGLIVTGPTGTNVNDVSVALLKRS